MGRSESFSKLKYQEKLQQEINQLLRRDFRDPRLQFVTITHVELNTDYSVAKAYWDTFDPTLKEDISVAMVHLTSKMRAKIAQVMKLRHTPKIEFYYNSQFEDAAHIDRLLKEDG